MQSIEWYHFQWPWVTFDAHFKVTTFFDIEYLRNDTRYSHSYYWTSIAWYSTRRSTDYCARQEVACAVLNCDISNDFHWPIIPVSRSRYFSKVDISKRVARFVSNSWVSCQNSYRATQKSAVFAVARCLSVRHVGVFYPHGWRYRQTSCSARLPHHSIFWSPAPQWGTKYTGMGKICDFRPKSPIISDTVRDRPMVAIKRL